MIETTIAMNLSALVLAASLLFGNALAYSTTSTSSPHSVHRRAFLTQSSVVVATTGASVFSNPPAALADDDDSDADPYKDFITTESGLRYKVLKEGDGAIPSPGQTVKTQYTGWLDGFDSIKKFDSSRDRGRPFTFKVATGQVIRGWDEAFSQMKVGERRQIILPPRLAYGDRGAGGIIPGGATLYFDVELLGIL